ncbi:PREDICTED: filament-like plant protein 6 isoform X2 [Tarenaya hassleriana]|uniref:filament-like plant protein 6 isoform X2 n=1 Tax=Tarenaya hassleriana TaxID=28532 RepID=UPI00053C2086|nr:PREDICTED: filament-like plant protein 6 isoform X2 [Tarenaya hassleriana]
MDRRSWPWKKKSSEKVDKTASVLEAAVANSHVDQDNVKKPKFVQISVEQYTHLTGLEEQMKTYEVQVKSYEEQVKAYDDQVQQFEDQVQTYDEQVQTYEEQVEGLNEEIKDLNEKLSAANTEITAKEALVKQHSKVAEDAVSGWEKAEAEALALKSTLESVTLSKLTAEDRAAHLDGALKECMRQIRNLKEDHEQKLQDVISTKTKQMEKLRLDFEKRISDFEQELLRSASDNDALSRTLQERSNMLVKISEDKSRAEAEIEHLKSNLESCEREIKSLKYEVHVVSKELEIRNEEKNMSIRSAEVANKQHMEGVKKIAKLEAECQRLRGLVRKKLPGPAALAQMKLEVESLGRDNGDVRIKRSPVKSSSPQRMSPRGHSPSGSDFSLEDPQKFQKENEFLTERLLAMEEETKMLKEALAKRNSELQESRDLCAQSMSKLQSLETQIRQISSQRSSHEVCPNQNASSISVSEDGNIDSGSGSEYLSATPSQAKKEELATLEKADSVNSHMELMDDFLEMEKLACSPNDSKRNGSMDSKDSSTEQLSDMVNSNAEMVEPDANKPAVMGLRSKISKVLESVSIDTDLKKIVADIKSILQEVEDSIDQHKPAAEIAFNRRIHPEEGEVDSISEIIPSEDCQSEKERIQSVNEDLVNALSRIHDFALLLGKEARAVHDASFDCNGFGEKVEGLTAAFNNVLNGEKNLDDFVSDLSNVLTEAMELRINFTGFTGSEEETLSPDCIDKVALPESKAVDKDSSKEIYQNGCVHINDPGVPCDENTNSCNVSLQEIEELKSEKEKMAMDLEQVKSKLQESEQLLAEIRSQFASAQRSNNLGETQLKCMTESYRSLEARAADLEIEVNQLKETIQKLHKELDDERRRHKDAVAKCQELQEQIQMIEHSSSAPVPNDDDDIKPKQERELAAAAEKLAECQETIFLLGKQLKSLRPQPEQMGSPRSQSSQKSEYYYHSEEEHISSTETSKNIIQDLDLGETDEVPRFLESPKCASDMETNPAMRSPAGSKHVNHVHSRSSGSSSSSSNTPTPEKPSRGFSRFFSTK